MGESDRGDEWKKSGRKNYNTNENSQFVEMKLLIVQVYVHHHKSHQLQYRSVSPYQNLRLAELRLPPLVSKDIDPVISSHQKLSPFLSTKGKHI